MNTRRLFLETAVAALLAAIICVNGFALGEDVSPEATEDARKVAARAMLEGNPKTVILYAKGLCCPSCAIGVRKMVSKLDFVDRSRFNKGVELDTKMQLVTVAITDPEGVDFDAVSKAIDKAGYDPVRVYSLEAGKLATASIERPK